MTLCRWCCGYCTSAAVGCLTHDFVRTSCMLWALGIWFYIKFEWVWSGGPIDGQILICFVDLLSGGAIRFRKELNQSHFRMIFNFITWNECWCLRKLNLKTFFISLGICVRSYWKGFKEKGRKEHFKKWNESSWTILSNNLRNHQLIRSHIEQSTMLKILWNVSVYLVILAHIWWGNNIQGCSRIKEERRTLYSIILETILPIGQLNN